MAHADNYHCYKKELKQKMYNKLESGRLYIKYTANNCGEFPNINRLDEPVNPNIETSQCEIWLCNRIAITNKKDTPEAFGPYLV